MRSEAIVCPICGTVIWSASIEPIYLRSSLPSKSPHGADMLTEMALASQRMIDEKRESAEAACLEHFTDKHPRRLYLFAELGWKWPMLKRWPWSKPVVGDGTVTFRVAP